MKPVLNKWPQETLEKLAAAYTKQTQEILGLSPDKISVIINEIAPNRWVRGGVTFKKMMKP
jgi:phenylpyruvate tautomerase PptA (4-oxalocrotonate tautomerase family)